MASLPVNKTGDSHFVDQIAAEMYQVAKPIKRKNELRFGLLCLQQDLQSDGEWSAGVQEREKSSCDPSV